MADQAVERRPGLRGFVELGEDAGGRTLAETRHRLLDCRALLAGGDHRKAAHAEGIERLSLAGARVGRRKAGGIDQHQLVGGKFGQQPRQPGLVFRHMQRYAQQVGIHRQLRRRADAVGVGRHQRHLCRTVRIRRAGGELGQRGGFSGTGGPHQRVAPPPGQQIGFAPL